jgi:hypothetical protein
MARRTTWVLILCVGLSLGLAPAARAQEGGLGTLAGTVVNSKGRSVAGAHVILQSAAGDMPQATTTNSQGRFFFPQLLHGYYDVRATASGKASVWRHNLEVRTGHQTDVTLRLTTTIGERR